MTPGLSTETLVIVILVPILSLVLLIVSGIMFWIFCRRRNSDKVISERWMNHFCCSDKVKHSKSMTHEFYSLIDTLLNVYRSIYLVNIIMYVYFVFTENWGKSWTNLNRESWKVSGRCQYPPWTLVTRRQGRPGTSRSATSCSAQYLLSMRGIL